MFFSPVSSPPPIRLIQGSPKANEGLPQIQFRGEWGAICHYWYDREEASAICRQLGYSGYDIKAMNETRLQQFGSQPSTIVWLDGVICVDYGVRIDLCTRIRLLGAESCTINSPEAEIVCDG